MAVGHVPAWKRLGLKLRYAKESPDGTNTVLQTIEPATSPKKRKLLHGFTPGYSNQGRQGGTTKVLKQRADGKEKEEYPHDLPKEAHQSPSDESLSSSLRKRKSVSFAGDTKLADGGKNAKELYKAGSVRHDANKASETTENAQSDQSVSNQATLEKVGSAKKLRNPKEAKPRSIDSPPMLGESSDQDWISRPLQYLNEYQKSRSTWKFNKARQSYILKHALELEKIPRSYGPVLQAYIMGLEGRQARVGLHNRAQEVIDTDDAAISKEAEEFMTISSSSDIEQERAKVKEVNASSSMPNESEDTRNLCVRYRSLVSEIKKKIGTAAQGTIEDEEASFLEEEWRMRFLKRQRAEMLLWSTAQGESSKGNLVATSDPEAQSSPKNAGEEATPQKTESRRLEDLGTSKVTKENGVRQPNGTTAARTNGIAHGAAPKRRRRPKKRRDMDDESSSESSSSSSSSSSSGDDDR